MQTRSSFAQLLQTDHEYCAGSQTSISSIAIGQMLMNIHIKLHEMLLM